MCNQISVMYCVGVCCKVDRCLLLCLYCPLCAGMTLGGGFPGPQLCQGPAHLAWQFFFLFVYCGSWCAEYFVVCECGYIVGDVCGMYVL